MFSGGGRQCPARVSGRSASAAMRGSASSDLNMTRESGRSRSFATMSGGAEFFGVAAVALGYGDVGVLGKSRTREAVVEDGGLVLLAEHSLGEQAFGKSDSVAVGGRVPRQRLRYDDVALVHVVHAPLNHLRLLGREPHVKGGVVPRAATGVLAIGATQPHAQLDGVVAHVIVDAVVCAHRQSDRLADIAGRRRTRSHHARPLFSLPSLDSPSTTSPVSSSTSGRRRLLAHGKRRFSAMRAVTRARARAARVSAVVCV